jgi:hypothetical protein
MFAAVTQAKWAAYSTSRVTIEYGVDAVSKVACAHCGDAYATARAISSS